MKKILVMFFVICALAFVYGCGGNDEPAQPASTPTTTTADTPADTTPAPADDDAVVEDEDDNNDDVDVTANFDPADPFANQGPITQADVDNYIKVIPKITASAGDEAKLMDIYKEVGWDEWRGAYILSKVGTAYAISMSPDYAEMMTAQLPESLKPSQAEIDLVAKAQSKITSALMAQ